MEYSISIDGIYETFEGKPEEITRLIELMYGEGDNIIEEGVVELREGCEFLAEPLKPITVELNLNTSKVTEGLDKIEEKLDRIIEKYERIKKHSDVLTETPQTVVLQVGEDEIARNVINSIKQQEYKNN